MVADNLEVKMFDIMPSTAAFLGNPISEKILSFGFDGENYLYAGHSNYLPEDPETFSLQIDWTRNNRHYGIIGVYTDSDTCLIDKQRIELEYGEHLQEDFDGAVEEITDLRYRISERNYQAPPNNLAIGDEDDEDYDWLL